MDKCHILAEGSLPSFQRLIATPDGSAQVGQLCLNYHRKGGHRLPVQEIKKLIILS